MAFIKSDGVSDINENGFTVGGSNYLQCFCRGYIAIAVASQLNTLGGAQLITDFGFSESKKARNKDQNNGHHYNGQPVGFI